MVVLIVLSDFKQFLIWKGRVVLKEPIFSQMFHIWEGLVVLKELIFNSFYIGTPCGVFERTDF